MTFIATDGFLLHAVDFGSGHTTFVAHGGSGRVDAGMNDGAH